MDFQRSSVASRLYAGGIKKSKNIEDKGQKYDMLNNDLHSIISNINSNFDFKSFDKNNLGEVEIVSL